MDLIDNSEFRSTTQIGVILIDPMYTVASPFTVIKLPLIEKKKEKKNVLLKYTIQNVTCSVILFFEKKGGKRRRREGEVRHFNTKC